MEIITPMYQKSIKSVLFFLLPKHLMNKKEKGKKNPPPGGGGSEVCLFALNIPYQNLIGVKLQFVYEESMKSDNI